VISTPKIPVKIRDFDAADVVVRERFDAWHDSFGYFYDVKRAVQPDHPANWRHQAWDFSDLLITTHDLGPFVGHRGPAQIKRFTDCQLMVRYVREGVQHSLHEDSPVVMKAGHIYVYRKDRGFHTLVKDRVKTIAVGVSYSPHLLKPDLLPNFLALEQTAPNTTFLMNVMERIEATVHSRKQIAELGLDVQFREVLLDILTPQSAAIPCQKSSIKARRMAMKAFVDQHFDKPDFDIEQLLSEFGASRATVFRDFAQDGGLQHHIVSLRLDRAFDELAKSPPIRGRIQQVAEARGFANTGHFSTLFRHHFGTPPSDVVMIGQFSE